MNKYVLLQLMLSGINLTTYVVDHSFFGLFGSIVCACFVVVVWSR
jgi:hypothetical protein